MKNRCILPWISLETTPVGEVRACCLTTDAIPDIDLTKNTLTEAFNSEYMRKMRQIFRKDRRPAQCERCWVEEDAGKKSKREHMLDKFDHIEVDWDSDEGSGLVFLDLKLGNICNLKCRICGSWSSSKWAQEEIRQYGKGHQASDWLRQGQWPRKAVDFWDEVDGLLPKLKYFEFTGGEPFLIKQHFDLLQRAVDGGYAGNIDIHYNTNGTQFPEEHTIWKHFKAVQIAFSIDNTGARFEYERDGADWQAVNQNIQRFQALQADGYPFDFQICVTWNIQNVLYMRDFLQWAGKSGISDIHFNLMHDPEEFSLVNTPSSAQSAIMLELQKAQVQYPEYADRIHSIKRVVMTRKSWPGRHTVKSSQPLLDKLYSTDKQRGVRFSDSHPEIAKLIGYKA